MKNIKVLPSLLIVFLVFFFNTAFAQDKEQEKVEASVQVLEEFGKMEEAIPQQLMDITQGIVIIPKMINAGFVVGGKRGKGIAMVKNANGSWSDPVFITLTGGSVGFQAGVQSVDLVLVFRHKETLQNIGKGSFTLGGDISVAAGPMGRSSSANTDYKLEAEVYSYSRSRGLFAGISLSGSALEIDSVANRAFYGQAVSAKTLFSGGASKTNSAAVNDLKEALENFSSGD